MSINIPVLRIGSPGTVPAGQTWIVREYYTSSTNMQITVNSNTYDFTSGVSPVGSSEISIAPKKVPILHAADVLGGFGSIYYWILELDFGTSGSNIPLYRHYFPGVQQSPHDSDRGIGSSQTVTYTYTYTVPAGQTWYIALADIIWSSIITPISLNAGSTCTCRVRYNKDGAWLTTATDTDPSPDTTIYNNQFNVLPYTGFILRAGDQIEVQIQWTNGAVGGTKTVYQNSVSFEYRQAYYILEQDF